MALRLKRFMKRCALTALILLISIASVYAWPVVHATGTTFYDPQKAHSGYVLYTPMDFKDPTGEKYSDGTPRSTHAVLLINMKGSIVHFWEMPFDPISTHLLPNGHLVVNGYDGKSPYMIPGTAGKIVEFDWDGKQVFEYEDLAMHHSFKKLPNGNYLYLAFGKVPESLQTRVRGGIKGSELADGGMLSERLVEINPKGKIVWQWDANDHLDPDLDIIGPHYTRDEWLHCNSIEVLSNGNIALCSRSTDSVIIIDKKSGRILHRLGSPTYLDRKTGRIEYHNSHRNTQFIGGPHDIRQIPTGYPGAGNLTIYDNGMYTDASRAVEIDPATRQVTWFSRQPGVGRKQFSNFAGSTQRLSNGNTLMCEGSTGRFVQITPENEVVWEYINPYVPSQKFQGAVLKADQYEPDYCPQFKKLPPAKSAAILPPDNDKLRLTHLQKPSDKSSSSAASSENTSSEKKPGGIGAIPVQVAILCITACVAFLMGKQLSGQRS